MIYVNARAIIERCVDNRIEIVVQTRNNQGDSGKIELPGGQVNEYESLIDDLKREVLEETGLMVTIIDGEEDRIMTKEQEGVFSMECLRPYAVYQTLSGLVNSMGVYFRCQAEGKLKDIGDYSLNARLINLDELKTILYNNPELFSDIDKVGIMFYLRDKMNMYR